MPCSETCCSKHSDLYIGCTHDCESPQLSSCQVVDDQLFIVPSKYADVVFEFASAPSTFKCKNWYYPEGCLTEHLIHNRVPSKIVGFRACLMLPSKMKPPYCGND